VALGAWEIALAVSAVAAGAAVQASLGFGLALIAAPLVLLIDPALIPGPMIASVGVLTLLVAGRERQAMDVRGVAFAVVGRAIGTAPAALFLAAASQQMFDLAFGGLVLLAVALSMMGLHVIPGRRTALAAGMLAGFMATVSGIGGPPMALLYQRSDGPELRGTLSGISVLGTLVSLAALWSVGRFGRAELELAALLIPGSVIGFAVSGPLRKRLDRGSARPFLLALSAAAALAVVWRAV